MRKILIVMTMTSLSFFIRAETLSPNEKHVVRTPTGQNIVSNQLSIPGLEKGYKILNQTLPADGGGLLKAGEKAIIVLRFKAVGMGDVTNVTIQRSSGLPKLDSVAIESISKWRFKPSPYQRYVPLLYGIVTFEILAI